jgi:hypothetical protein
MIGNWLIVAPQHILKTDNERKVYAKAQDSIINLFGLKLISFTEEGKFIQIDSIFAKPGAWAMDSLLLNIKSEGLGFERFAGRFAGVVNDTIMITEFIKLGNEEVKLVWNLKKIFSPLRVFLPFQYYQHGVGLKEFWPYDSFVNNFFDVADAKKAYDMIKLAMMKIEDDPFPSGENFVIEYARYFERVGNILEIGDL